MAESVSFDRVADRYDATRGYPPEVALRIADGLMDAGGVPDDGSVLEIGIGTGRIALPVLATGRDVTGVDIAQAMVERLREKYAALRAAEPERPWGALRVELGDVTALSFADASFDAAVAVHVLHLIPEWRRAVDEVLRVLRPGGALLIGQDVRLEDDVQWRMQGEWMDIVRKLGFPVSYVGAAGYSAIKAELERRGLPPREEQLAAWEVETTPRGALAYIVERTWSRTWQVPAEIFDEAARRLTEWVAAEYGDAMDTPQWAPVAFKVAVTRVPAGQ
jgi:ubiquinone/menaquinone biosynthesis C-methylase UbiE